MATILSHGIVGLTSSRLTVRRAVMPKSFWYLAFFASMLPDVDAIGLRLGVPYAHCWGHRGATHSILFAAVMGAGLAGALYATKAIRGRMTACIVAGVLFLAIIEHAIVDAMTNGGLGVAFFWPYSCKRYFFGFRPIQVSPLTASRFLDKLTPIVVSEMCWLVLPCLMLLVCDWWMRQEGNRKLEAG
jgi:inner membrane protein